MNEYCPGPALVENKCECEKKHHHKHHKHHKHDKHHKHHHKCEDKCECRNVGFEGYGSPNNLFFVVLVIAIILLIKKRNPVVC
jgi:hypothetical protein